MLRFLFNLLATTSTLLALACANAWPESYWHGRHIGLHTLRGTSDILEQQWDMNSDRGAVRLAYSREQFRQSPSHWIIVDESNPNSYSWILHSVPGGTYVLLLSTAGQKWHDFAYGKVSTSSSDDSNRRSIHLPPPAPPAPPTKVEDQIVYVRFPYWFPTLLASILPIAWCYRRYIGKQLSPNHCRTCGYDIRATPTRCPECGTEII